MHRVDIVVSGYEWVCPECEHYQEEMEYLEFVKCERCGHIYEANPPEHTWGIHKIEKLDVCMQCPEYQGISYKCPSEHLCPWGNI